jgi:hypothetical protein
MGLLALVCVLVVLAGLYVILNRSLWGSKKRRRVFMTFTIAIAGWMVLVAVLVQIGYFNDFSTLPPRPVLLILLPLPFVFWIAFSKKFRGLATIIPQHWLVYFQSFRIVVELLLWQAFLQDLLPVQMTFEGRNLDIIAGLLALPAGYALMRRVSWSRKVAFLYNIIGLGLLLNILIISLLSMPTPFRYFTEGRSIEVVAGFPMAYLPTVLVVLAYSFHILSLRQLWLLKQQQPEKEIGSKNLQSGYSVEA